MPSVGIATRWWIACITWSCFVLGPVLVLAQDMYNPITASKVDVPSGLQGLVDESYGDEAVQFKNDPKGLTAVARNGPVGVSEKSGHGTILIANKSGKKESVDDTRGRHMNRGGFLTSATSSVSGAERQEFDVDQDGENEENEVTTSGTTSEAVTRDEIQRKKKREGITRTYSTKDEAYIKKLRNKMSTAKHSEQKVAAGLHATEIARGTGHALSENMGHHKKQDAGVDKQRQQCAAFSAYLKSNHVRGTKLVSQWRNTCSPAANAAPEKVGYKNMCDALVAAVTPFAADYNWNEAKLCDAVIVAFNAAGL